MIKNVLTETVNKSIKIYKVSNFHSLIELDADKCIMIRRLLSQNVQGCQIHLGKDVLVALTLFLHFYNNQCALIG